MRTFTTTERYVPQGYELSYNNDNLNIQVYFNDTNGCYGLCFVGKAKKATWHYRFKSADQRNQEVERTFKRVQEVADYKAEQKAKKLAASANHGVIVGDVFKCSWGYDQTNVDYYEVISISGKTAVIREIGALSESCGYLQGTSVPAVGRYIGKPQRKLIQKYSAESAAHFKVNSFSHAYKIEPVAVIAGKPIYEETHWTAYA